MFADFWYSRDLPVMLSRNVCAQWVRNFEGYLKLDYVVGEVRVYSTGCAQWVRKSEGYLQLDDAAGEMRMTAVMLVVASLD